MVLSSFNAVNNIRKLFADRLSFEAEGRENGEERGKDLASNKIMLKVE